MSDGHNQPVQDEHGPAITVTEARQGRRGGGVIWVLGVSMALIVAGFAGLWLSNAPRNARSAQPMVSSKTVAKGFDATPSPASPTESAGQAKP
jgi:hypothetical protein